jgi:hypothetical protein
MTFNRHINDLYKNLSHKAKASVRIHIRTEKIGLYGYLNFIKRTEDPWYGCDQASQTVHHIIKDCECLEDIRFT